MMNQAYTDGFNARCAELGIDPALVKRATPVMSTLGESLAGEGLGGSAIDVGGSMIPFVGAPISGYNAVADFANMVGDRDLSMAQRAGKLGSGVLNTAFAVPGVGLAGGLAKGLWRGGAAAAGRLGKVMPTAARGAQMAGNLAAPMAKPVGKWLSGGYKPFGATEDMVNWSKGMLPRFNRPGWNMRNMGKSLGNAAVGPMGVGMALGVPAMMSGQEGGARTTGMGAMGQLIREPMRGASGPLSFGAGVGMAGAGYAGRHQFAGGGMPSAQERLNFGRAWSNGNFAGTGAGMGQAQQFHANPYGNLDPRYHQTVMRQGA